jgi:hypothetical protein
MRFLKLPDDAMLQEQHLELGFHEGGKTADAKAADTDACMFQLRKDAVDRLNVKGCAGVGEKLRLEGGVELPWIGCASALHVNLLRPHLLLDELALLALHTIHYYGWSPSILLISNNTKII